MKNCLNNKCAGEIKLLYDYGNNSDLAELNVDCTQPTKKFLKPKIYICKRCELKFSEIAIDVSQNIIKKISDCLDKDKSVLEVGSYYGVFGNIIKPNVKSYSVLELSKHGCDY